MAESKILEEDKDEWIYHSMNRYTNLYMFELEFPVDALEVIDNMSLCLSGLQAYSKKCELLQLSIPPKLFPKDIEEGLCKDRDFQIISGGYASGRILQIKPIRSSPSFVAATELGRNGITLFKLGNEDHAVIDEKVKLSIPEVSQELKSNGSPGVIDTFSNRIAMGSEDGQNLYEWTLDENCDSKTCTKHVLNSEFGGAVKMKYWDENSVTICTDKGTVNLFDLRGGKTSQDGITFYPSKSPLKRASGTEATTEPEACSNEAVLRQIPVFTFDTIPSLHKIGIVDSYGGYESFDVRNVSSCGASEKTVKRGFLSEFDGNSGIIRNRFNIEFKPLSEKTESMNEFILTGLREESVHVVREEFTLKPQKDNEIKSVFIHDGHSKTVSHALWHPNLERLVFSASIDSMLHAWQYKDS